MSARDLASPPRPSADGAPSVPRTRGDSPAPPSGDRPAPAAGGAGLRLDIQGLRAVAVTLVVVAHAGVSSLAGGFVGVDVFFVISGFLITSLMLREWKREGRISLGRFYARRAMRLLPASTLVVMATLAGSWLFLGPLRFAEYAKDAIASAWYVVNFRLADTGTDYFNTDVPPSPFQHFWSLAVEEQFYLIWPVLLIVALKIFRRRALLAIPLLALAAASFAVNLHLTETSPSWAYFGSQGRIWELAVGALLALVAHRLNDIPRPVAAALSWAGLAAIAYAAVAFDDHTVFPGHNAVVPVLGAAAVLAGGAAGGRYGAGLVLSLRPAVWVGGVSYAWYLWHWPLIVIVPAAAGFGEHEGPLRLIAALGGLVLAWLTLKFVEDPMRFHRAFKAHAARGLSLGLGLSAVAAVAALVAAQFPPSLSSGGAQQNTKEAIAHGDQRRLAGAGVAHEGHVGDGLELQDDVAQVARLAEQREAGGLAPRRGEGGVAEAAAAALGGDVGGAVADEVGEDVARLVEHHGAVRHGQDEVLPVLAGAVAALAGLAVGGLAVRRVVVVEQGGHGLVDGEDHIAAASAVAPVGAAERLELLAMDGGTAVTSVTRGDMQLDAVHEGGHGKCLQLLRGCLLGNTRKADPLPVGEVRSASRKCPVRRPGRCSRPCGHGWCRTAPNRPAARTACRRRRGRRRRPGGSGCRAGGPGSRPR
ncbi:hypothetical protein SALBM217S_07203 [Streptomyces griseoloalbus]